MTTSPSDILRSCRFFQMVQGKNRQRLESMAGLQRFAAGEMIFQQGDPCPGLFVVGAGLVRIYKLAPSGKEHVLHLVGMGGTFAEVAVIGGFPCPAFAEALEDTTCVMLPRDAFRQALRDDHDLCLQLMGGMAMWVHHLVGLVESITLRDAAGRLAHHLLQLPADSLGQVKLPALKRHLASHLNLTSETLSRVLRSLKDQDLIETAGEVILIKNRDGLEAIAEGMTEGENG